MKRRQAPSDFKKRTQSTKRELRDFTERLHPKTEPQAEMIAEYRKGKHLFAHGSAGTGKTFIACGLAMESLQSQDKDKIIIIRSAVSTRDQGFLPGTLDEKMSVFSAPYVPIINYFYGNGSGWETLTKKNQIEFISTSYCRGMTFDNCVIIIDEFQNMDASEIETILGRVGENTQVILCGDTRQNDLSRQRETSGFHWMTRVAEKMPKWFSCVEFLSEDIVRSGFVRDLIMTIERM